MERLTRLLGQCEDDTRRLLGDLAAKRLGNWRRYAKAQAKLMEYVERLLWGEHRQNGKSLISKAV